MDSIKTDAILKTSEKVLLDAQRRLKKALKNILNTLKDKLREQIENGLVSKDFKEVMEASYMLEEKGYEVLPSLNHYLEDLEFAIKKDFTEYIRIPPHTVLLYVMERLNTIEDIPGTQSKEEYLIRKYIHAEIKRFFRGVLPILIIKNLIDTMDKVFPLDQDTVQDKLSQVITEAINIKIIDTNNDEKNNTDE